MRAEHPPQEQLSFATNPPLPPMRRRLGNTYSRFIDFESNRNMATFPVGPCVLCSLLIVIPRVFRRTTIEIRGPLRDINSSLRTRINPTVLCSSQVAELRLRQRSAKFFYRGFDEKRVVNRRLPRTSRERKIGTIVIQIDVNRVTQTYLATRHQV